MRLFLVGPAAGLLALTALTGCAENGGILTTQSNPEPPKKVAFDPRCVTLTSQIEALRADGTVTRVENAADGKTRTVVIKRAALAKVAELNKAQAEYQRLCSKSGLPGATTATSVPAAKPAATTGAVTPANAADTAAKAKASATAIKQAPTTVADALKKS